ncbi:MAG: DUF481 domain-containing protein [Woeseiaceae bacterium]|nr:DUF481 domain-containing protein [Woeseiaceae bacterium]
MLLRGLWAILVCLSPCAAIAQASDPAADKDPWTGTASLGFLSTSGNTDTTSYNSAFKVSYTTGKWVHTLDGAANGAEESGMTTAEAYQAGWRSTYDVGVHSFVFGEANYRKDRFAGVEQQLSQSIGYGRRLIETEKHLLSAEIGVGYAKLDFADDTSESSAIATAGLDYKWTFTETSNFEQNIDVESGSENTYIESVSAVRARLLGDFALVLSYTIKHNTDVPLGSEKTDRLTAVSLEYAF